MYIIWNVSHYVSFNKVDAEEDTSDTEEESSGHFFIPGDDEEDLIGELTEISHDVIKISPRVIGQGAFGVVKYGTLLSVKGSQEVAIKMLKQRSGNIYFLLHLTLFL